MSDRTADLEALRGSLQTLSRGALLVIAQRSIELVPNAGLPGLLGDFVEIDALVDGATEVPSLLEEVRQFHAASLSGEYYEEFPVNGRNYTEQSKGTDAFIADLGRIVGRCIREADIDSRAPVREAFEIVFSLLRHIDQAHCDVIFFADEGGSWCFGLPWRTALPAYFRCLAETAPADEFARNVAQAIADFAGHDHGHYMSEALRVASAVQQASLSALASIQR